MAQSTAEQWYPAGHIELDDVEPVQLYGRDRAEWVEAQRLREQPNTSIHVPPNSAFLTQANIANRTTISASIPRDRYYRMVE